jgi:hypothetical protein
MPGFAPKTLSRKSQQLPLAGPARNMSAAGVSSVCLFHEAGNKQPSGRVCSPVSSHPIRQPIPLEET